MYEGTDEVMGGEMEISGIKGFSDDTTMDKK
jgi:hypothetical protein